MVRSRSRKTVKHQLQTMAGIPVNRAYVYEKLFFKEDVSVLQGILFPLRRKTFESGKIKLGKAARLFGASGRGLDLRNISYPGD